MNLESYKENKYLLEKNQLLNSKLRPLNFAQQEKLIKLAESYFSHNGQNYFVIDSVTYIDVSDVGEEIYAVGLSGQVGYVEQDISTGKNSFIEETNREFEATTYLDGTGEFFISNLEAT